MARKETKRVDLVIIGGGAAGLAAAIAAKETAPESQIALLEKNAVFGKKLRVTGSGRANISNRAIMTCEETVTFFHYIGILTRTDTAGRIYPFSESAAELTDAMVRQAEVLGCDLYLNTLAEKVEKSGEDFRIETGNAVFISRKLILATGGKAGIASGERQKLRGKDGYVFAEQFGHHIERTTPVLTGVEVEKMPAELAGIRVKGEVRLMLENHPEPLFIEKGEIQFTDYGLSGICIFNLSRFLKYQGNEKLTPYRILIDLDPLKEAETLLKTDLSNPLCRNKTMAEMLGGMFKKPVRQILLRQADIDPSIRFSDLSGQQFEHLIQVLHGLSFQPKATKGFQMAQCTAGGVSMTELDPENGASKLLPGLYIVGELMDFDGPCGGYNLDHAFRTGALAGKDAVKH